MMNRMFRLLIAGVLAAALPIGAVGCSKNGAKAAAESDGGTTTKPAVVLHIQAAASLKDSLNEISEAYTKANPNVTFAINYDGSGTLQTQIEQGAVADLFFSAAKKNMDPLEQAGLLLDGTRADLITNSLVVVVPKGSATGIETLADLANSRVKVIALADPEASPAGKYAQQALVKTSLADAVQAKAVLAKDVKAVLAYVETGDADAGIVFKTDALTSSRVDVVASIDPDSHDPIVYPVAVIKASTNQDAAEAFLEYVSGSDAAGIFEEYGFGTIK